MRRDTTTRIARPRWSALLLGLGFVACCAGSALAQTAKLQVPTGPYYQGEPVDIQIVVTGFAEEPTPEMSFDPPKRGQLELLGVDPSVRSNIAYRNGKVTSSKHIQFVYRYRLTPSGAGALTIGPFAVAQGTLTSKTRAMRMDFKPIGKNERVRIQADWPRTPVYPGQRMEVTLTWTFDASLHDRMQAYDIQVPIFDRGDLFRYIDSQAQRGDTQLNVHTSTGPISLKAQVNEGVENGRRVKMVTAKRILIPLQPGEFVFEGATVMVQEVTRYRRDLFGQRTPQAVRKVPAADEPRSLVVKDVPGEGRPDHYAGAIGRGFSLDVKANRSVVQVGDPIELELTLHGDGNLESASLPDLTALGSLAPDLFRVPSGQVTGMLQDGAKTFRIQLRVLDASVREIPPLPYSYFDTDKQAYVTVESQPIALSVRRAQIVTADDVVSTLPEAGGEPRRTPERPRPDDAVPLGDARSAAGSLVLSGANLSIVREPAALLHTGGSGGIRRGLLGALYTLPVVAMAGALWVRRRADLDPVVSGRRKLLRSERQRIANAAGEPRAAAMASLANALRAMLRAAPEARPADLDAFLAECDAIAYAPGDAVAGDLDPAVHDRAMALARMIEEGAE